jgi:hypothetical protein
MRRREFISLLGSAVAWPLAARAQQVGKPLIIGVLGASATVWAPWMAAFVARLRELGWVEGHTIAIEYRWTEGSAARVSEIGADPKQTCAAAAFGHAARHISILKRDIIWRTRRGPRHGRRHEATGIHHTSW